MWNYMESIVKQKIIVRLLFSPSPLPIPRLLYVVICICYKCFRNCIKFLKSNISWYNIITIVPVIIFKCVPQKWPNFLAIPLQRTLNWSLAMDIFLSLFTFRQLLFYSDVFANVFSKGTSSSRLQNKDSGKHRFLITLRS